MPRRLSVLSLVLACASAREYFVSVTGDDSGDGSAAHPLRTVQRAASLAVSGDIVTVRAGVYRERVRPPRSGVTYQAAPGEAVTLTGAEAASGGWARAGGDAASLAFEALTHARADGAPRNAAHAPAAGPRG